MKNLSTVSLFIFGVVVTSIMTAGLVFYQNGKDSNKMAGNPQAGSLVKGTVDQLTASGKTLTLNMTEISKHNKSSNCWLLISGKVYDITGYFGSHPGGNSTMAATCGKDATAAYATKNSSATGSGGGRSAHSSGALGMLANYLIGDLNQTVGSQNVAQANAVVAPTTKGDDDWEDD